MVLRQRSDDGGARSQLTREWLRVGQLGLGPSTLVEDGAATPRIPLGRSVAEITTGVVSPQVQAETGVETGVFFGTEEGGAADDVQQACPHFFLFLSRESGDFVQLVLRTKQR
jgi:hypothetical protein